MFFIKTTSNAKLGLKIVCLCVKFFALLFTQSPACAECWGQTSESNIIQKLLLSVHQKSVASKIYSLLLRRTGLCLLSIFSSSGSILYSVLNYSSDSTREISFSILVLKLNPIYYNEYQSYFILGFYFLFSSNIFLLEFRIYS